MKNRKATNLKSAYKCHCGGYKDEHILGVGNCFRGRVPASEIPKRTQGNKFMFSNGWVVTEEKMKDLGYDWEDGVWNRPKDQSETGSLDHIHW